MTLWMVRAERDGALFEAFAESSVVALGWPLVGNLDDAGSLEAVKRKVAENYPEYNKLAVGRTAGMLWRIRTELEVGDQVVTYDPSRRMYNYGTIEGAYRYDDSVVRLSDTPERWPHIRPVRWKVEIERDLLSKSTRNSLGSLISLFQLPSAAAEEFAVIVEKGPSALGVTTPESTIDEATESGTEIEDIEGRSLEFIKDMVANVSPNDMERLVAGLLRALGFKTRISPVGPDRGQDILASPDALGIEDPRIIVEVKHRKGTIGAPEVRGFLGGRQPGERGLYVSTGGFTKEARYESDRANIPLRLITIDDLVELLVEYYEELDVETRGIIPLRRIFWPVN